MSERSARGNELPSRSGVVSELDSAIARSDSRREDDDSSWTEVDLGDGVKCVRVIGSAWNEDRLYLLWREPINDDAADLLEIEVIHAQRHADLREGTLLFVGEYSVHPVDAARLQDALLVAELTPMSAEGTARIRDYLHAG